MSEPVWHPYEGAYTRHVEPEVKRSLEWTMVKVRRGDLERLDKVITFVGAMAELFSEGMYDDLWNMRNGHDTVPAGRRSLRRRAGTMSYFRKKPVVVQAVRFLRIDEDGKTQLNEEEPNWIKAAAEPGGALCADNGNLLINTLEGVMECSPGDWIIRGIEGELYPCKPDIFQRTYERAPPPASEASTR